MIPYGTLSLVGVHARWTLPTYARATAPKAKYALKRLGDRLPVPCRKVRP